MGYECETTSSAKMQRNTFTFAKPPTYIPFSDSDDPYLFENKHHLSRKRDTVRLLELKLRRLGVIFRRFWRWKYILTICDSPILLIICHVRHICTFESQPELQENRSRSICIPCRSWALWNSTKSRNFHKIHQLNSRQTFDTDQLTQRQRVPTPAHQSIF